jgi:hypothetical protein
MGALTITPYCPENKCLARLGSQRIICALFNIELWRRATPTILTSWKEIANHLGKGIRTVQRWEQAIGLPVRRPHGRRNGVVLAHCDEIDAWTRTHFEGRSQSELEALRKENAALRTENKLLRERAERLSSS